jgi:CheY-like chemotaxis protein
MAKILAIDDSIAELKFMEAILNSDAHNVLIAVNGENAEEIALREQPDLILLDIVMPLRNGYEILRKLRRDERTKSIPVCMVSSKNEASDVEWAKRQGANQYLAKPYTSEALMATVASLTAGSTPGAELQTAQRAIEPNSGYATQILPPQNQLFSRAEAIVQNVLGDGATFQLSKIAEKYPVLEKPTEFLEECQKLIAPIIGIASAKQMFSELHP